MSDRLKRSESLPHLPHHPEQPTLDFPVLMVLVLQSPTATSAAVDADARSVCGQSPAQRQEATLIIRFRWQTVTPALSHPIPLCPQRQVKLHLRCGSSTLPLLIRPLLNSQFRMEPTIGEAIHQRQRRELHLPMPGPFSRAACVHQSTLKRPMPRMFAASHPGAFASSALHYPTRQARLHPFHPSETCFHPARAVLPADGIQLILSAPILLQASLQIHADFHRG